MCGISGFVEYKKRTGEDVLRKMSDTLIHRGPDSSGIQIQSKEIYQIGLAHRRLSIIDLSECAAQPMQFKGFWITFNGEIYNYQEIRAKLIAEGNSFESNSDTEVILHAFLKWGIECVHQFIGMFAFLIYDQNNDELFIFRDRAGVKPFFYYKTDELFLFASELKAFHAHPNFVKAINHEAVAAFMQFGNVPAPHCIFNNCFKLLPGHYLKFNLNKNTFSTHNYWNVYRNAYNHPKLDISLPEAIDQTEKLLQSACNYRMVSDVPVGVFLSGGYDSVSIATLLQTNKTEKIKTFTIAVPDIGLDESQHAKKIADVLGTEHYEFKCEVSEVRDICQSLPYFYDEPFADSSAIPTMLVSKKARQQVTVALSGDGGDETFAGYNRYNYIQKYGSLLKKIPSPLRKMVSSLMTTIPSHHIPFAESNYNFHQRYNKLKHLLKDPSDKKLMMSLSTQFPDNELDQLLTNAVTLPLGAYNSNMLQTEFFSSLSYMMAIDYETYLPDDILQKVDRASMSVSLEAREPLLDHRLIEFVARLPDQFKYNNGEKKYLLKQIVHKYIPKKLMDRPKMGFAIPIEKWLANDLRNLLEDYLNIEEITRQQIFKPQAINKLKSEFLNGKKEKATKLWHILMFQMWYRQWM